MVSLGVVRRAAPTCRGWKVACSIPSFTAVYFDVRLFVLWGSPSRLLADLATVSSMIRLSNTGPTSCCAECCLKGRLEPKS
eukprot:6474339-Amphidinium_carterae.1